jgi:tripartite ATP-independent transporter DctP family solute receptor
MRTFIAIGLFIAVGLLAAFFAGFRGFFFTGEKVPYDEEQKELSKRIIIKFSHVVAENTPKGLAAQDFARRVHEKTEGKVEVQVFPNATLYSEVEEIKALMRGDIQMIAPASPYLSDLAPAWLAFDLPFAFPDERAVEEAVHGEIGELLFASLEPHNMKGLAFWNAGFKQMSSSKKPLIAPDDFKGQRFRIMPSEVLESQFAKLGARTLITPFNEVYESLETGKADGQENTVSNIYTKKFYQVQKYMTISNHNYLGYAVILNNSFWNKLPEEIKHKIEEASLETTRWMADLAIVINNQQMNRLREDGAIQIHDLTPEQKDAWIAALDPVYDQFAPLIGADLIRRIREVRDKYKD